MNFTKVEKITFSILTAILLVGVLLLFVKIGNQRLYNRKILSQIHQIQSLTNKEALVKKVIFHNKSNQSKLNLNKADFFSIKSIPCLNPSFASRIYDYIKNKGSIAEMKELLAIKGMNKTKLADLEKYATAEGGHGGNAAWGKKINLNFTNEKELTEILGLTGNQASKIIEFRDSQGGFKSIDELYAIPSLNTKVIDSFIEKVEVK